MSPQKYILDYRIIGDGMHARCEMLIISRPFGYPERDNQAFKVSIDEFNNLRMDEILIKVMKIWG